MDNLPKELVLLITDFLSANELKNSQTFLFYQTSKYWELKIVKYSNGRKIQRSNILTVNSNSERSINPKKIKIDTTNVKDEELPLKLPKHLKHLIINFDNKYGYYLDDLFNDYPLKLKELKLLGDFNDVIDNLPNSLKYLRLSEKFNRKILNLPSGLKKLKIGMSFNRPLNNLPNNLKYLFLGGGTYTTNQYEFNQTLEELPSNLIKLRIMSNKYIKYPSNIPDSIKYLKIKKCIVTNNTIKLPSNLIYWYICEIMDENEEIIHLTKINVNFPKSLTNIEIIYNDLIVINENIKSLRIWKGHNIKMLDLNLSKTSLSSLDLSSLSSLDLMNVHKPFILPATLKKIRISSHFDKVIEFPESIEYIILTDDFNQKINLPNNLKYLKLGKSFNQDLNNIPKSLRTLILKSRFNKSLEHIYESNITRFDTYCIVTALPKNLEIAKLRNSNQEFNFDIPLSLKKIFFILKEQFEFPPNNIKYFHIYEH